ncbi:MAG TPA: hypothetical protein V6C69_22260 [Trichormus sp.]|jgi:hypothetical protein
MTRHAYEAAKCQETKDVEIVLVPEDTHQTWQHISQSMHHPHHPHHQHPHHYPHHQVAQGAGEQHQVAHNPEHHTQAHLTSEQARAKADQQQWDESTQSITSGVHSLYKSAANPMRDGVNAVRSTWDALTDNCTLSTSWIDGSNTRNHARELERQAKTENQFGNYQLADRVLNRDLQFSVSAFGLTDKLTVQLSKELRELHKQHSDLPHLDMLSER